MQTFLKVEELISRNVEMQKCRKVERRKVDLHKCRTVTMQKLPNQEMLRF